MIQGGQRPDCCRKRWQLRLQARPRDAQVPQRREAAQVPDLQQRHPSQFTPHSRVDHQRQAFPVHKPLNKHRFQIYASSVAHCCRTALRGHRANLQRSAQSTRAAQMIRCVQPQLRQAARRQRALHTERQHDVAGSETSPVRRSRGRSAAQGAVRHCSMPANGRMPQHNVPIRTQRIAKLLTETCQPQLWLLLTP